jgi:divalent metal cation (Fe/Co/Zn/Cd) transporter
MTSLLDAALPAADLQRVTAVLERSRTAEVDFADLRTRESGRHRFVSFTVVVPGAWTVDEGHDLADQVEVAITKALPDTTVHTHIEPRRTS